MQSHLIPTLAAIGCVTLAGLALAHDDDPKLLGRELPYQGPGFESPLDLMGVPTSADAINASVANCGQFPCFNARLLANMPTSTWGASSGNDCWGYTSASGREYALMGLSNGTAVVEITYPGHPQTIKHLPGSSSTWRDIKTYGTYAYAVSEGGGGVQVFDLSQIDSGVITTMPSVGSGNTHNVAIDTTSGFLYRVGSSGGVLIYDLNPNPGSPTFVATWSASVHDLQAVTYTSGPYAGRQIAYLSSGSQLRTLDVTNKSNMFILDQASFGGTAHQSWLSEDRRYCYLDDELSSGASKTFIFDVFDPANIVFLGFYSNGVPSYHHNLYVNGDFIYEANYTSGLRVFDTGVSQTNPPEVAYLDTYPANNNTGFSGLWSCYPFFPSGVVIGSDTSRGLFIARFGEPQITFSFPGGQPPTTNASGDTIRVLITAQPTSAIKSGSAMLHYDAGAGLVSVPLMNVGGDLYDAAFPALPCNTQVNYYVSASSTTNIVWTSPELAPPTTWTTTATCPSGPFTYCVAKTNSCGAMPALSFSGSSSASQSSGFTLDASGAGFGKAGLVVYSDQGTGSNPFEGGTLCVNPVGIRRGPATLESGATPGNCDGTFSTDINAFASGALGGSPQAYLSVPGTVINLQQWGRDTVANGSYLSDAGQYVVGP
jgi:choice-of-anchor B domain-containing protein